MQAVHLHGAGSGVQRVEVWKEYGSTGLDLLDLRFWKDTTSRYQRAREMKGSEIQVKSMCVFVVAVGRGHGSKHR